jgi:hypothetical protein
LKWSRTEAGGDHHGGAAAQGLKHAQTVQPAHLRAHRDRQAGDDKNGQAHIGHRFAAEMIRQRPAQPLAQRHAQHIDAHRQLNAVHRHAEVVGHGRQRRQVGVDGERPEGHQSAEHDRQAYGGNGRHRESLGGTTEVGKPIIITVVFAVSGMKKIGLATLRVRWDYSRTLRQGSP